jgi:hypothetical protein
MIVMPSRAEDLFAEIEHADDKTAYLEGWVPGRQETVYLDFKRASRNDADNGETWSKAVSAYANTEGGVLVWGIDAKKPTNPQGSGRPIDCAQELKPLSDPEAHIQFIKDITRDCTNEPVHGIRHLAIPSSSGQGGYVVSLVPEGRNKPYRAEKLTGKPYYQRIGANTEIVPHGILRSLFFPKTRPSLRLLAVVEEGTSSHVLAIGVMVTNSGLATAKDVVVFAEFDRKPTSVMDARGNLVATETTGRFYKSLPITFPVPLHPGQNRELFGARIESGTAGYAISAELRVTCYMADEPPQLFRHRFMSDELAFETTIEIEQVDTPELGSWILSFPS